MSVKLLTEHHLEILSLKGGSTGSSESTLFKMPHCWKSHAEAHIISTHALISSHLVLLWAVYIHCQSIKWHIFFIYME